MTRTFSESNVGAAILLMLCDCLPLLRVPRRDQRIRMRDPVEALLLVERILLSDLECVGKRSKS